MVKKGILICVLMASVGWSCINLKKDNTESDISEMEIPTKPSKIIWHWENRFNKEEVFLVKSWLNTVFSHTQSVLGNYPFDIHFYIHRSSSNNEPVPWAHTSRDEQQGVHFHISTKFSLQEFLNDWTAPHEISHLSIPFVGQDNMWFSEGYATFMQVQILHSQGVYSDKGLQNKFSSKFAMCKPSYQSNMPVVKVFESLRREWNYPHMYWGGASFFWKLNQRLNSEVNISLMDVIKKYEQCCRINESSPNEICAALDSISNSTIASTLLIQYQTQPAHLVFTEF